MRNLPEEVISMIGDQVRDMVFRPEMNDWVQSDLCLTGDCTPLSHFSAHEIHKTYPFCTNNLDGSEINVLFRNAPARRHCDLLQSTVDLSNMDRQSKISRYAKLFTQDFGLRPHIWVNKAYHKFPYSEARAYLILSFDEFPMALSSVGGITSFAVNRILEVSTFTHLTADQRQKFKIAATALNLHAYDPDEDESIYQDKPRNFGCRNRAECRNAKPNWNSPSGIKGEGDGEHSKELGFAIRYWEFGEYIGATKKNAETLQQPVYKVTELEPRLMILAVWGHLNLCQEVEM